MALLESDAVGVRIHLDRPPRSVCVHRNQGKLCARPMSATSDSGEVPLERQPFRLKGGISF
jgi:hypothetical protein